MSKNKLLETIINMRIDKTSKFDKLKKFTNSDEGIEIITIYYENLYTRKVNDWGREEDKDFYLGLDESGWIVYKQVNHNLAGPFKIIDEQIIRVDDEYVLRFLEDNEDAYNKFMSKVS